MWRARTAATLRLSLGVDRAIPIDAQILSLVSKVPSGRNGGVGHTGAVPLGEEQTQGAEVTGQRWSCHPY